MKNLIKLFVITLLITSCDNSIQLELSKSPEISNSTVYDSIHKQWVQDSIKRIAEEQVDEKELKKFYKTPAGKIYKKHPEWNREDCENLANNKIWIGMSIDMLKYQRGKPNDVNISNCGSGTRYQWCWDDYKPRCFYGSSDGIITAYN